MVLMSCNFRRRFWARIGYEVRPECLNIPEAQQAMRAARQIAGDTKSGPQGMTIVLQRLRRWMDDGKIKYDDVLAVGDMFLAAQEEPPLAEESVIAELAPVLKKRIRHAIVLKAMEEAQDEDEIPFKEAQGRKLIEKAATLGAEKVADLGIEFGSGSYEAIESVKHVVRLSTGIEDLDLRLKGGPRRGGFSLWVGPTGSGKSTALAQRVARGMSLGMNCALATLELSVEEQLARIKANLTGIPFDDILDEPRIVEPYLSQLNLGNLFVQTFPSGITTVTDIRDWVDLIEQTLGKRIGVDRVPIDFLAVDYADLLGVPTTAGKEGEHGYTVGKHVFGALRMYAEGEKSHGDTGHPGGPIWVDTASAATRAKDKRKRITTEDVADSMHKTRRATLVVSINPQEGGEMIEFFVTKNTHGPARFAVGPLPADFAAARIAPVIGGP